MAAPTVPMMDQKSSINRNAKNLHELNPIFHEFLSTVPEAPNAVFCCDGDLKLSGARPSASASLGVFSGEGSGPISTTADLALEKNMGNPLEGIPFFGVKNDVLRPEFSSRFTSVKCSNSDSAFIMSSRNEFPQIASDSLENSHVLKMLKNGSGGGPPQFIGDEHLFNVHPRRPKPYSLELQIPSYGRHDGKVSKLDQSAAFSMGTTSQPRPLLASQVVSNIISRDIGGAPSMTYQSAADEGSRTGLRGSGIFSSINPAVRTPSIVPPCDARSKPGSHICEPVSSTPSGRHELTSSSRQMTIFYGGQAHVFDDVHPSKAEKIMAIAGSSGGSWSALCSPNYTLVKSNAENKRTRVCGASPAHVIAAAPPPAKLAGGVSRSTLHMGECSGEEK